MAKLIYSKYLISIPMLFDLLTIYGRTNAGILGKIFDTVMKIEPKYLIDLEKAIKFTGKTLASVQEQMDVATTREDVQLLNDLCLHTLDCAVSIGILLDVYPEARDICVAINMEQTITSVYDNFIPCLYRGIFMYNEKSSYLNLINRARVEMLSTFRSIVNSFIEKILNENQHTKKTSSNLEHVEALLSIFTLTLSENTFVTDYQRHYPIENDIEVLRQACPKMDTFKADFILQAFLCADENNFAKVNKPPQQTNHVNGFDSVDEEGACALPIESEADKCVDIDAQIQLVQDILPDLGDGFVRKLLERYDNAESAISAVLEGNLPPDLDECDKAEIYIPPDRQDQLYLETGVRRINVFDGDDYDVRTSEAPRGIIKTGKGFPGQPKTVAALLDDKSHVKELKSRYEQYSIVEENCGYDDEYDDSYDALTESESKKTARKPQSMRDVLVDEIEEEDEDEDDEQDVQSAERPARKNPLDFCENPEDIRARYEQRRQQKFGGTKKNADVVGKAKGQGQTNAVLASRQKKEVHKSSRANHNRKQGASWKKTRGMIPS
uniref:Putative activating signal cointegrator 1 complex subunit 2-like protein n=1 Tax=Lutzomyia longipalpis TaxID=7200 RepID=A0A7G3AAY2_LUTLO